MKKKIGIITFNLSLLLLVSLGIGPSVSANSETEKINNQIEIKPNLEITQVTKDSYEKNRSYYFYDMLQDYYIVQDSMRQIYGNAVVEGSYGYKFAILAQNDFDNYYRTDDIEDLQSAMDNMYNHHVTYVGNNSSYSLNYRLASNNVRSYVPSSFNKDFNDIIDFSREIG